MKMIPPREATMAELCDEMNEAISDVERSIIALDLGVSAECKLPSGKGTIGFGKVDLQWRLYFVSARDDRHYTPLRDASREIRIEAVGQLPGLVALLQQASADQLGQVRDAITAARALVDQLRRSAP